MASRLSRVHGGRFPLWQIMLNGKAPIILSGGYDTAGNAMWKGWPSRLC